MKEKQALLLIDLQKDFCNSGNLAVPAADEIIPIANKLQPIFDCVIATQDWHPQDHLSFASNHPGHKVGDVITVAGLPQVLWPDHCLQHQPGAEFHSQLDTTNITKIFQKGVDKTIDSYSAFFDNAHLRSTGLAEYLSANEISRLYMMGLATDYCVKYSALDAAQLGFDVWLIEDACRGVELTPGDVTKALAEMAEAGVKFICANTIWQQAYTKL